MQYTSISEDRIRVLIGKDGETKKKIEDKTHTQILISGTDVTISGSPYYEMLAQNIIDAINLGFNPEKALLLTKDYKDYSFEFIPLSEKRFMSIRGRIIGTNRSVTNTIEKISDCYVNVGKEGVGIIGDYEDVEDVKEAIEMIINNGKFGTAYRFLENKKRQHKDDLNLKMISDREEM